MCLNSGQLRLFKTTTIFEKTVINFGETIVSHPFGDLVSQHLHRKHGLSQSKLAAGILQPPAVVTAMCKGKRLTGPRARERVVSIINWLHQQDTLTTLDEANAMLNAAGMAALNGNSSVEVALVRSLQASDRSGLTSHTHTSVQNIVVRRTNIPSQLTSFVGREQETAELTEQVKTARLLTLAGVGGIGKTRLAFEVAGNLLEAFAAGVWLVELAPLSDSALLAQTVANVFKLPEQPGRPHLDVLVGYLETRHLLLILDNCEHLIDACAALVEALLQRCPQLHVLATSRETLRVPGEVTHRVPSLTVPDGAMPPDNLLSYEAVRLFHERAITAQPMFEWSASSASAVVQICNRLDGIPLAIELAVARLNVLSAGQIAERLNDRFNLLISGSRTALPRHQTLHAAITWSYDLLSQPEQALLMRLSVFAGGFTAEAAEFISGQSDTLTLLSNLVDKSLVIAQVKDKAMRYRLLETIRQFANEKLVAQAHGEVDIVRQRHAAYYLALVKGEVPLGVRPMGRLQPSLLRIPQAALWTKGAESLDPLQPSLQLELKSPPTYWTMSEYTTWCELLASEHDNLRAALSWGLADAHNPQDGVDLVLWLHGFWFARGPWSEAIYWLERALAVIGEFARTHARARLLASMSHFVGAVSNQVQAEQLAKEALAICRELGDQLDVAFALGTVVNAARERGNFVEARALGEEWLAVSTGLKDPYNIGVALFNLGEIALAHGDAARAVVWLEQSHSVWRELGDKDYIALVLNVQGNLACYQSDYERATTLCRDALVIVQNMGSTHGIATTLHSLGDVALFQNDMPEAKRLFEAGLFIFRDTGNRQRASWCLAGLAAVAAAEGHGQRAVTLWEAAEAIRASICNPRPALRHKDYGERVVIARSELDEQGLNAAVVGGRAMTLEQAIDCVKSYGFTEG